MVYHVHLKASRCTHEQTQTYTCCRRKTFNRYTCGSSTRFTSGAEIVRIRMTITTWLVHWIYVKSKIWNHFIFWCAFLKMCHWDTTCIWYTFQITSYSCNTYRSEVFRGGSRIGEGGTHRSRAAKIRKLMIFMTYLINVRSNV